MKKENMLKLVFSIIICQAAGLIGALFTSSSVGSWYSTIQKPAFNPPNWIFGPVWTTLYILMGVSLYVILTKRRNRKVKIGLTLFGIQLVLNSLWSFLFFGLERPLFGLIEIPILWVFILLTIIQFWKIDKKASYLLIPYLLWVTFAAVLNYYIWFLN